jgi:hypothetical protein
MFAVIFSVFMVSLILFSLSLVRSSCDSGVQRALEELENENMQKV